MLKHLSKLNVSAHNLVQINRNWKLCSFTTCNSVFFTCMNLIVLSFVIPNILVNKTLLNLGDIILRTFCMGTFWTFWSYNLCAVQIRESDFSIITLLWNFVSILLSLNYQQSHFSAPVVKLKIECQFPVANTLPTHHLQPEDRPNSNARI